VETLTTLNHISYLLEDGAFSDVFVVLDKLVASCYEGEVDRSLLTQAVYRVFRGILALERSDLIEGLFLLCSDHPTLAGVAFHIQHHLDEIDAGIKTVQQYVDFFGEMHIVYGLSVGRVYDQAVERALDRISQSSRAFYTDGESYLVFALRRWLYAIDSRYGLQEFRLQLDRAQALMIHRMSLWQAMHALCKTIEEILEECPPGYYPELLPLSSQNLD